MPNFELDTVTTPNLFLHDARLSSNECKIYWILCTFASSLRNTDRTFDKYCNVRYLNSPSIERIRRCLGIDAPSVRGVKRGLKDLKAHGYLGSHDGRMFLRISPKAPRQVTTAIDKKLAKLNKIDELDRIESRKVLEGANRERDEEI